MKNAIKMTSRKTITLRHIATGQAMTVFQSDLPSRAWFLDDPRQDDLQWLGGAKAARDLVKRYTLGGHYAAE